MCGSLMVRSVNKNDDGVGNRYCSENYSPPQSLGEIRLTSALSGTNRIAEQQLNLFGSSEQQNDLTLYYAGDISLLRRPCVAIVGTRQVSADGRKRARTLACDLVDAGFVIVSGLAKGVDTEALSAAVECGGRVIAVIGTPLDRAYPAKNRTLQETIHRQHLLISQFPVGRKVYPSNFPRRNKLMAVLSDATAVIEASDTSGTLHQAAECSRIGRGLFITKNLADDPSLKWPSKFLKYDTTIVMEGAKDIKEWLHKSPHNFASGAGRNT